MKIIIFSFFIILFLNSCAHIRNDTNPFSPDIRVLIGEDLNKVELYALNEFNIPMDTGIYRYKDKITLEVSNNNLILNSSNLNTNEILIYQSDLFLFNDTLYEGNIMIYINNNKLYAVNILPLERYLLGVVAAEMNPDWHIEALKSQAVVSRTYSINEIKKNRNKRKFDLYSDTRSQVYKGIINVNNNVLESVYTTYGEILTYNGKPIEALFHSSSGGMTESSKEIFQTYYPYLESVISPFSQTFSNSKWNIVLNKESLSRLFNTYTKTNIKNIVVSKRSISKRISSVSIITEDNRIINISGKDLRNLIGPTVMKSLRANLVYSNDNLYINGVGYGHGVGMGQWDALAMANSGYNYTNILNYFYSNTILNKIW